MSKYDCNGDMNFIYPRKLDLKFTTEKHLYLDDQTTVTVYETGLNFYITYLRLRGEANSGRSTGRVCE